MKQGQSSEFGDKHETVADGITHFCYCKYSCADTMMISDWLLGKIVNTELS